MSKLDEVASMLQAAGITGQEQPGADPAPAAAAGEDQDGGQHPDDLPPGETPDDDLAADPAPADLVKLSAVAEKLGLADAELYDKLEIPMGGNQVLTLGEVKDMAIEGKKAMADIANVRETADNQSRELMIERQELYRAAELLAPVLTPKAQEQLEAHKSATNAREIKLLLAALPTWKNQDTAKKELGRMEQLAAKYGISGTELAALVQDHRLVKMVRDVSVLAPEKKPTPKPGGRHQNKPNTDAYQRAKAAGASKTDKIQGIASLLN